MNTQTTTQIFTDNGWVDNDSPIDAFGCLDCGERAAHAVERGNDDNGQPIVWAVCEYCVSEYYAADCEAADVNRDDFEAA